LPRIIFVHGDPVKQQQLVGWVTYREASVISEGDLSSKQICREFSPDIIRVAGF
jgi:hypothetical protein